MRRCCAHVSDDVAWDAVRGASPTLSPELAEGEVSQRLGHVVRAGPGPGRPVPAPPARGAPARAGVPRAPSRSRHRAGAPAKRQARTPAAACTYAPRISDVCEAMGVRWVDLVGFIRPGLDVLILARTSQLPRLAGEFAAQTSDGGDLIPTNTAHGFRVRTTYRISGARSCGIRLDLYSGVAEPSRPFIGHHEC